DFDVLMEIWYPDMETLEACSKNLQQPEIQKEINEDEEKLFDLTMMRSYIVEEHDSDMQNS
ncbi:MAG: EthD domain-containing protein, partial [Pseudomonadota bacterium]|nr:EthD domain-containing protein [Pseudomonadota bacterium]MEC9459390.1 EthD domain-containing protein [Pseudomonadota bacterium]